MLWVCLMFISGWPLLAYGGDVREAIAEGKLREVLTKDTRWSLNVVDMKTARETINAGSAKGEALVPASLMKLVVAGATLDRAFAGDGLHMTTTISYDGVLEDGLLRGNLYLVGLGNALLSAAELETAVRELSRKGLRSVEGDIIADSTFFESGGFERNRKGAAYAIPSALGLDLHTAAVTVIPTEAGEPPQVRVEPGNGDVRFSVSARTVSGMKNTIKIRKSKDDLYHIEGNIRKGGGHIKKRFALESPALFAAGVLKVILVEQGVKVRGKAIEGKVPADSTMLVKIAAPELEKLIHDMNMNSLNVVADNLLLLLGAERFGRPGSAEKGIKAAEEFLAGIGELRGQVAKMADGSGLSEKNRINSAYFTGYLYEISKRPWFKTFKESLPEAGSDRVLMNSGFDNPRFRVKTARLEEAYGLAGYGIDNNDRPFAFSYIVNGNRGEVIAAERSGGVMMRILEGNNGGNP